MVPMFYVNVLMGGLHTIINGLFLLYKEEMEEKCGMSSGLENVLNNTGKIKVYVHPDIFRPKYIVSEGKEPRYNGLSKTKEEYEKDGARFILREQSMEIGKGMYLIGPIERERPSEDKRISSRYLKEGNELIPDSLADEQVLTINTSKGLVLILGCTHNGLINTVEKIMKVTGGKKIYGIIGGLHLYDTSPQKVKELALWLNNLGVELVSCCHCTGQETTALFSAIMGDKVFFNYVGRRIVLD